MIKVNPCSFVGQEEWSLMLLMSKKGGGAKNDVGSSHSSVSNFLFAKLKWKNVKLNVNIKAERENFTFLRG